MPTHHFEQQVHPPTTQLPTTSSDELNASYPFSEDVDNCSPPRKGQLSTKSVSRPIHTVTTTDAQTSEVAPADWSRCRSANDVSLTDQRGGQLANAVKAVREEVLPRQSLRQCHDPRKAITSRFEAGPVEVSEGKIYLSIDQRGGQLANAVEAVREEALPRQSLR